MLPTAPDQNRPAAQDQDVIDLQVSRWDRCVDAHSAWQNAATLCTQMVEGEQWSAEDRAKLAAEGRPPITLNKINPLRRLLTGYFRQNQYDLRYLPGTSGNDESARALTHTAKQVSEANQTPWNEGEVFNDGLTTARGYFDIRIDYTRNIFGDIAETVLDPFSVYPDPEGSQYDPTTWQFVMISRWLSWESVAAIYGPATAELVDTMGVASSRLGLPSYGTGREEVSPERWFALESYVTGNNGLMYLPNRIGGPWDWIDRKRKLIRVIECQHFQTVQHLHFIDLETGSMKPIPPHWDRERVVKALEYWRSLGVPLIIDKKPWRRVKHTHTAADVVLYDQFVPESTFTVVPYFPYFRRGKTRGFVDDLIDPQRELNKRRTAFLHIISTMANGGWTYEEGSLDEENEQRLEEEGAKPGVNIRFKKGRAKPERIQPAAPPTSVQIAEKMATADLKEISGINDSALGNLDRVQSGRAIISRQRQSIVGAEEYFHNFSRTRELRGRKILELIQLYYTEKRLIRVRGEGGQNEAGTYVDMMINAPTPEGRIANMVAVGDYNVAVDEAPLSATFEDQEFDDIVTMVRELGVPIPPDIIVEASSVGKKRIIVDAIRAQMGVPPAGAPVPGAPGAPPGPPVAGGPPVPMPAPNGVPLAPRTPQAQLAPPKR